MKKRTKRNATSTKRPPRTMAEAGVDYDALDPAKRLGQAYAAQTEDPQDAPIGLAHMKEFRGESACVFRTPGGDYVSHVEEGLGTMNLVAEALYKATGSLDGYQAAGVGAASAILNDIATTGVLPISLQLHFAVGDDDYLKDESRLEAFYVGWLRACKDSGLVWTGGEMPALKKIVTPGTAEVSGSAMGWLSGRQGPIVQRIMPGDRIIALASSGIQTNGWTQVRTTGEAQRDEGVSLFKQALTPSVVYVNAVRALYRARIDVHYAIHVSGHGWRKIMRADADFTYVIEKLPRAHGVFRRLQRLAKIPVREMYRSYNMGVGFVFIVPERNTRACIRVCRQAGYRAYDIGFVRKGPRKVVIRPLRLTLKADELKIR